MRRLESLFRQSLDPLYGVDSQRRIVYFNTACEALTGLSAKAVLGRRCRLHGPVEDDPAASLAGSLCPPPEALAGQPATTQVLLVSASGERLWRAIDFFPCRGPGEQLFVLGRIRDATADPPGQTETGPLRQTFARLRQQLYERYGFDHIAAASPAMQRVLDQVRLASQSSSAVLFLGERGVGRETLARIVHYQGPQRARAFAALDCQALPALLLEEQLFGEGGPVPGFAGRPLLDDPGVGAVYLREPEALPRDLQARLCTRLDRDVKAQATRILAGSSADLLQDVREGKFLPELYFRLSTIEVRVPPLRDRREDTFFLVQQTLERCNAASEKQVSGVHLSGWRLLQTYAWPGNLPELIAAVEKAREHAAGPEIFLEDFPMPLRTRAKLADLPAGRPPRPLPLDEILLEAERRLIQLALRDSRGNKSKAAVRLHISRARLLRRMELLGLLEATPAPADAMAMEAEEVLELPDGVEDGEATA